MSLFKAQRTSQPQGQASIDWNNPITRGLIEAYLPIGTRGVDVIAAAPMPVGVSTVNVRVGKYGRASVFSSSLNARNSARMQSLAECSIFAIALNSGTSATTEICGYGNSGSANPLFMLGMSPSSPTPSFRVRDTANTNQEVSGGTWASASDAILCGTRSEAGNFQKMYVNGLEANTAAATAMGSVAFDRWAVGGLRRNTDGLYLTGSVYLAAAWNRALSPAEVKSLSDNPWQIFVPANRSWALEAPSGGATTHTTTGALTGQSSIVAGSAARTHAHPSSGVLAGAGATVDGSAARTHEHPSSGVLTGAGAAVDGAAARAGVVVHDTTGTPTGAGASVVGSAAHVAVHGTSGTLVGSGSVLDGTAQHNIPHGTSGDLTGSGSLVTGSALNGVTALTKSGVNRAWLVQYYTKAFAEQEARRKESAPKAVKPKGLTKRVIEAKIQESVTRAEEQLERLAKQARDIQEVQLFVHQAVQQATLAPDPAPVDFMAIAESYRKKLQQEEEELLLLAAVL